MSVKPLDCVLIALFAIVSVLSIAYARKGNAERAQLRITSSAAEYVYPLDADGRHSIPGDIGDSVIAIKDGAAYFEDSPCPNKTCATCAPISHNGEWIACLPNQIFIRVEGNKEDVDGMSF